MGQKRYERTLKQDARRKELEEFAKRPRPPSIRQKVAAYNAELIEKADLSAIRGWSEVAPDEKPSTSGARAFPDFPDAVRVVFGNLPVDLAPDVLAAALQSLVTKMCANVDVSALDAVEVATFGPCRPKTRRDRDRENRGFAVCTFRDTREAEEVIRVVTGCTLASSSARWPERPVNVRLDDTNECDLEFVHGLRGKAPVIEKKPKKEPRKRWKMNELETLPMRQKCLSTHTRFSDLNGKLRVRLLEYFSTAVAAMPELACVILEMEKTAPHFLRLKELIESIESFNLVIAHLNSAESTSEAATSKVYDKFFDLACGHGLVGIMIAYALPKRTVYAFDHTHRPAFYAYCRAFAKIRDADAPWSEGTIDWDAEEAFVATNRLEAEQDVSEIPASDEPVESPALSNIVFTLGDIEKARPLVNNASVVIALHGCNEANKVAVEMARDANAIWCAMPCCIKASLYLPETVLSRLDDSARYNFLCGVMCHEYGAQLVRAIDSRITNRPTMLCGGIVGYRKHCFVIGNNSKIQRERAKSETREHRGKG